MNAEREICNECGRSVKVGSELFINRVISLDGSKMQKLMGEPFPNGKFMCMEYDNKLRDNPKVL
jgi:hypothetical protein